MFLALQMSVTPNGLGVLYKSAVNVTAQRAFACFGPIAICLCGIRIIV